MSEPMSQRVTIKLRGQRSPRSLPKRSETLPRSGRIPRVTKLLALAHRFEQLLRDGVVQDYAELARLGHVTRARVTQIMNLLHLAPQIQESILFWPPVTQGRDPLTERQLRKITHTFDWGGQRELFERQTSTDPNSIRHLRINKQL